LQFHRLMWKELYNSRIRYRSRDWRRYCTRGKVARREVMTVGPDWMEDRERMHRLSAWCLESKRTDGRKNRGTDTLNGRKKVEEKKFIMQKWKENSEMDVKFLCRWIQILPCFGMWRRVVLPTFQRNRLHDRGGDNLFWWRLLISLMLHFYQTTRRHNRDGTNIVAETIDLTGTN
jgi:hypothetical protein